MENFVLKALSNIIKKIDNIPKAPKNDAVNDKQKSSTTATNNQNDDKTKKTAAKNNIESVKQEENKNNKTVKKHNQFKLSESTDEENSMVELNFDNKKITKAKETEKANKTKKTSGSSDNNNDTAETKNKKTNKKVTFDDAAKVLEDNMERIQEAEDVEFAAQILLGASKGNVTDYNILATASEKLAEAISKRDSEKKDNSNLSEGMKELDKNYNAVLDAFANGELQKSPDTLQEKIDALDSSIYKEGIMKANIQEMMLQELDPSKKPKEVFKGISSIITQGLENEETEEPEKTEDTPETAKRKELLKNAILSGSAEELKDLYKTMYGDLYTSVNEQVDISRIGGIIAGIAEPPKTRYVKISELTDDELGALMSQEGFAITQGRSNPLGLDIGERSISSILMDSEYDNVRIKNNPNSQKAIGELKEKNLELNPQNVDYATKFVTYNMDINEENLGKAQKLKDKGYDLTSSTLKFVDNLLECELSSEKGSEICERANILQNEYNKMPCDEAFALSLAGIDENTSEANIKKARKIYASGGDPATVTAQTALKSAGMEVNDDNIKKATNLVHTFSSNSETLSYLMQPEKYAEETLEELVKIGAVGDHIICCPKPEQGNIHPNIVKDVSKLMTCYEQGINPIDGFVPTFNDVNAALDKNSSVEIGDVFQVEGEEYIRIKTDDDKSEELNISRDTYFKLFPPIERYGTTQDGIGNCWEIATLNSIINDSVARASLLKMFSEKNENIEVKFPNGTYGKVVFENGEMPEGTNERFYSNGALGIQMLEYADGLEIQQDMINEATAYFKATDIIRSFTGEKSQLQEFTEYMDENNGNVYIWYEDGELKYENYEEYIKNPVEKAVYDTPSTQYRHGNWPTTLYNRIGLSDVNKASIHDFAFIPAEKFDNYVFTYVTKFVGNHNGTPLNEEHGLVSGHAYRLEPGNIEDGRITTFKLINPWGITETELTYQELLTYGDSICYATKEGHSNSLWN